MSNQNIWPSVGFMGLAFFSYALSGPMDHLGEAKGRESSPYRSGSCPSAGR
jgi:hypothetical protein